MQHQTMNFYVLQYIDGRYIKKREGNYYSRVTTELPYELSQKFAEPYTSIKLATNAKNEITELIKSNFERERYPFDPSLLKIIRMVATHDGPIEI